jgi:hypothetical protein
MIGTLQNDGRSKYMLVERVRIRKDFVNLNPYKMVRMRNTAEFLFYNQFEAQ